MFWSSVIELLRAVIFGVSHVFNGSVGAAVVVVSLAIRIALLPLTLKLARKAREHARKLRELKPELERLQKRYAKDPARLWQETSRLYQRRGVKQVDSAGMLGNLAQAPIFVALYSTLRRGLGPGIRFFWLGDTSVPNLLVTLGVAGLTAGALVACQTPETSRAMQVMTGVLIGGTTVFFLSSASALFALSTGAGSVVGIVQGLILQREHRAASRPRPKAPGPTP